MSGRGSSKTEEALALVLSRTAYGEADLIVNIFTDRFGKVSALARGARKSQKRFSGALEPMHTLRVELSTRHGGGLSTLRGAQITTARVRLLGRLGGLKAAGRALSWVRKAAPENTPEPILWHAIGEFLDELERSEMDRSEDQLGAFGLRLLETLGWGLNLDSCVVCTRNCPDGRAAWIHPERGGLVCRACGGGPFRLSGPQRQELHDAATGRVHLLSEDVTKEAERIVERALGAHLGLQDGPSSHGLG